MKFVTYIYYMMFCDPDTSFFPSNMLKIYHSYCIDTLIYRLAQVLTSFQEISKKDFKFFLNISKDTISCSIFNKSNNF